MHAYFGKTFLWSKIDIYRQQNNPKNPKLIKVLVSQRTNLFLCFLFFFTAAGNLWLKYRHIPSVQMKWNGVEEFSDHIQFFSWEALWLLRLQLPVSNASVWGTSFNVGNNGESYKQTTTVELNLHMLHHPLPIQCLRLLCAAIGMHGLFNYSSMLDMQAESGTVFFCNIRYLWPIMSQS